MWKSAAEREWGCDREDRRTRRGKSMWEDVARKPLTPSGSGVFRGRTKRRGRPLACSFLHPGTLLLMQMSHGSKKEQRLLAPLCFFRSLEKGAEEEQVEERRRREETNEQYFVRGLCLKNHFLYYCLSCKRKRFATFSCLRARSFLSNSLRATRCRSCPLLLLTRHRRVSLGRRKNAMQNED